jgi:hypothetical protein
MKEQKLKSEYHYRFYWRLAEATRTGWASLMVAAVLVYAPKFTNFFSVPVLAPVLAVLLAGPPLGTVLANSFGILTVAVPALTSTIAVLHVLKPPISIVAAIACTGVSSLLIAFLSETHILGRKISLAQVSIVYISAHFSPNLNTVTFPLKMLAPDCVGIVMAIIATLVPIPRLAVWEVWWPSIACSLRVQQLQYLSLVVLICSQRVKRGPKLVFSSLSSELSDKIQAC